MGFTRAAGMAECVASGDIGLDTALADHLKYNHYPPVPLCMIEPCKAAIEAAREDEWDRIITLPEGVTWRGETEAPARAIVEGHHLDAFI